MNAAEFMQLLIDGLSPLVHSERFVDVRHEPGFTGSNGMVFVTFYNLSEKRVREKRGGGAEAMNNRQLFKVGGFSKDPEVKVSKVQVEQLSNGIYTERASVNFDAGIARSKNMRKKTGEPRKVAAYIADYINGIAETIPPNFTHE